MIVKNEDGTFHLSGPFLSEEDMEDQGTKYN